MTDPACGECYHYDDGWCLKCGIPVHPKGDASDCTHFLVNHDSDIEIGSKRRGAR